MTVTKDDFEKIWASSSPLTPYSFSDSQYKEGWNFVGSTPPSRQMWDAFMQNADEKLKYLYQHEDIPLGHEYFTFNPNVPQGSLPLFGGEYSRETYADLWAWVQQQTGYLKTEAEWQTLSASNNGNVPYYSDGDGSTTFRVPSLKCWVRGANGTVSEVGSYLAAGLPNITGEFEATTSSNSILRSSSGAFSLRSPHVPLNASAGSGTGYQYAQFDASDSNSIYGNSTTVVPESVVGMWLVKAYGVIVDTGTIDEQQYIDDRMNAMTQYVNDKVGVIGQTYSADWTAITSSANNTVLTNDIANIPIGTYLVIGKLPFLSTNDFAIGLQSTGITHITSDNLGKLGTMATSVAIISVTNVTNAIRIVSNQSGACDFSYLERGGIFAIRLA